MTKTGQVTSFGTAAASSSSSTRIRELEEDRQILLTRLGEMEGQMGRLMMLYVATYQLHATLNPDEVQSTIVDIVLNLLGAEQFLLLLRSDDTRHYDIAIVHGDESMDNPAFASGRYAGGDVLVDATLQQGILGLGPRDGSAALATIPLRVLDATVGALVILKLLPHKAMFTPHDGELFDLIAAHAASALVSSRVYSTMARKLRTMEELMNLVKHG